MSYTHLPSPGDPPTERWDQRISSRARQLSKHLGFKSSLKYTLIALGALLTLHYVILGAFPESHYARSGYGGWTSGKDTAVYAAAAKDAHDMLQGLDPAAGVPGTFFRDSFPIKTMLAFWELAQKEVKARRLDTCSDQLGKGLIDAYHESVLGYCLPHNAPHQITLHNQSSTYSQSSIWCAPVHRHDFSKWWPYPAAPCISTNLRPVAGKQRAFEARGCEITDDGQKLRQEMGREKFLGSDLESVNGDSECTRTLDRTMLVVGRQDQWNPFHVAEDLVTTLVTLMIAAEASPELIDSRVQVVFVEGFGMDANHYTPLWDRVGAWAPRRLVLDPWEEGVCLTNTIHSIGAGASLLSAMGVGSSYTCASTLTWAAAHYYRHLFGLLPRSLSSPGQLLNPARPREPINILWLSRAKFDAYVKDQGDWSSWRGMRHIRNEDELLDRLRRGIGELCDTHCVFQDAQHLPETWTRKAHIDGPLPIRFAAIDPMIHALETQIQFVGHTNILMSSHGGALGLTLFLPPGEASVIELQVGGVTGNFHFQHMSYEMGHHYDLIEIDQTVDVDHVWEILRQRIDAIL